MGFLVCFSYNSLNLSYKDVFLCRVHNLKMDMMILEPLIRKLSCNNAIQTSLIICSTT